MKILSAFLYKIKEIS